jgi:hypothetical protein
MASLLHSAFPHGRRHAVFSVLLLMSALRCTALLAQ